MKRRLTPTERQAFTAKIGLESPGKRAIRAFVTLIACMGIMSGLVAFFAKDMPEIRMHQNTWLAAIFMFSACISIWFDNRTKHSAYSKQFLAEISDGLVEVLEFEVFDAIQVKELEDNGYAFYLKLSGDKVLFLMGQYLYEQTDKKLFPSTAIEIVYSPTSRFVLSCTCKGKYLPSSFELPPPSLADVESGRIPEDGAVLNLDFEKLKRA